MPYLFSTTVHMTQLFSANCYIYTSESLLCFWYRFLSFPRRRHGDRSQKMVKTMVKSFEWSEKESNVSSLQPNTHHVVKIGESQPCIFWDKQDIHMLGRAGMLHRLNNWEENLKCSCNKLGHHGGFRHYWQMAQVGCTETISLLAGCNQYHSPCMTLQWCCCS